ncbi:GGDEF domain-containing protein [Shewanella sp. A32]|uniref:GGDEF domain-containing protein n=1 Tax=Shewanella sp. A32 TaxID=3031327 RepID=UPI0023B9EEA7|nr:GGDEF domain-containing protein [Shewanella sp. A32]MDF0534432.1 GGDEF domain-containing protein [Shewanella sp. A32]
MDFQQWHLQSKTQQIRYIAFVTALLYGLYALLESDLTLSHPTLRWMVHGVLIPISLLVIGGLTYYPKLHQVMRTLLVIAPITALLSNLLFNIDSPRFAFFSPEIYLNVVWTFAISGLTLRYAAISASISVSIVVLITLVKGVNGEFYALHMLWLMSAYLFGVVNAVVQEQANKTLYMQQRTLAHSASSDGLTALWNRAKIAELYECETTLIRQHHYPMSLIMLDIDHFKTVNDTHGHAVGDSVLVSFANLLLNNVRHQDHVGRIGGEEFVILLPHTDIAQATTVAALLQEKINHFDFSEVGNKTASFGLTQYRHGESLSELLSRADKALYLAKDNGRNRIEVL